MPTLNKSRIVRWNGDGKGDEILLNTMIINKDMIIITWHAQLGINCTCLTIAITSYTLVTIYYILLIILAQKWICFYQLFYISWRTFYARISIIAWFTFRWARYTSRCICISTIIKVVSLLALGADRVLARCTVWWA